MLEFYVLLKKVIILNSRRWWCWTILLSLQYYLGVVGVIAMDTIKIHEKGVSSEEAKEKKKQHSTSSEELWQIPQDAH